MGNIFNKKKKKKGEIYAEPSVSSVRQPSNNGTHPPSQPHASNKVIPQTLVAQTNAIQPPATQQQQNYINGTPQQLQQQQQQPGGASVNSTINVGSESSRLTHLETARSALRPDQVQVIGDEVASSPIGLQSPYSRAFGTNNNNAAAAATTATQSPQPQPTAIVNEQMISPISPLPVGTPTLATIPSGEYINYPNQVDSIHSPASARTVPITNNATSPVQQPPTPSNVTVTVTSPTAHPHPHIQVHTGTNQQGDLTSPVGRHHLPAHVPPPMATQTPSHINTIVPSNQVSRGGANDTFKRYTAQMAQQLAEAERLAEQHVAQNPPLPRIDDNASLSLSMAPQETPIGSPMHSIINDPADAQQRQLQANIQYHQQQMQLLQQQQQQQLQLQQQQQQQPQQQFYNAQAQVNTRTTAYSPSTPSSSQAAESSASTPTTATYTSANIHQDRKDSMQSPSTSNYSNTPSPSSASSTHYSQQQQQYPTQTPLSPAPVQSPPPPVVNQITNWRKGELLGQGAYGQVFLGLNTDTGQLLAVKQVQLSKERTKAGDQLISALESEIALMSGLIHENIVRYVGSQRSAQHLNIFLEFVSGGSLASVLKSFGRFSEKLVKLYIRQILAGLDYLHKHNIIHRDIKGANILITQEGVIKLADFGAATKLEQVSIDAGPKSLHGTPYWMAPEVLKQTGHGALADIWSLGCTVIEMLSGRPPWSSQCENPQMAMFRIALSTDYPELPQGISDEAKHFIMQCLERDVSKRPNTTRLLMHPFVTDRKMLNTSWQFNGPMDFRYLKESKTQKARVDGVAEDDEQDPMHYDNDQSIRSLGSENGEQPNSMLGQNQSRILLQQSNTVSVTNQQNAESVIPPPRPFPQMTEEESVIPPPRPFPQMSEEESVIPPPRPFPPMEASVHSNQQLGADAMAIVAASNAAAAAAHAAEDESVIPPPRVQPPMQATFDRTQRLDIAPLPIPSVSPSVSPAVTARGDAIAAAAAAQEQASVAPNAALGMTMSRAGLSATQRRQQQAGLNSVRGGIIPPVSGANAGPGFVPTHSTAAGFQRKGINVHHLPASGIGIQTRPPTSSGLNGMNGVPSAAASSYVPVADEGDVKAFLKRTVTSQFDNLIMKDPEFAGELAGTIKKMSLADLARQQYGTKGPDAHAPKPNNQQHHPPPHNNGAVKPTAVNHSTSPQNQNHLSTAPTIVAPRPSVSPQLPPSDASNQNVPNLPQQQQQQQPGMRRDVPANINNNNNFNGSVTFEKTQLRSPLPYIVAQQQQPQQQPQPQPQQFQSPVQSKPTKAPAVIGRHHSDSDDGPEHAGTTTADDEGDDSSDDEPFAVHRAVSIPPTRDNQSQAPQKQHQQYQPPQQQQPQQQRRPVIHTNPVAHLGAPVNSEGSLLQGSTHLVLTETGEAETLAMEAQLNQHNLATEREKKRRAANKTIVHPAKSHQQQPQQQKHSPSNGEHFSPNTPLARETSEPTTPYANNMYTPSGGNLSPPAVAASPSPGFDANSNQMPPPMTGLTSTLSMTARRRKSESQQSQSPAAISNPPVAALYVASPSPTPSSPYDGTQPSPSSRSPHVVVPQQSPTRFAQPLPGTAAAAAAANNNSPVPYDAAVQGQKVGSTMTYESADATQRRYKAMIEAAKAEKAGQRAPSAKRATEATNNQNPLASPTAANQSHHYHPSARVGSAALPSSVVAAAVQGSAEATAAMMAAQEDPAVSHKTQSARTIRDSAYAAAYNGGGNMNGNHNHALPAGSIQLSRAHTENAAQVNGSTSAPLAQLIANDAPFSAHHHYQAHHHQQQQFAHQNHPRAVSGGEELRGNAWEWESPNRGNPNASHDAQQPALRSRSERDAAAAAASAAASNQHLSAPSQHRRLTRGRDRAERNSMNNNNSATPSTNQSRDSSVDRDATPDRSSQYTGRGLGAGANGAGNAQQGRRVRQHGSLSSSAMDSQQTSTSGSTTPNVDYSPSHSPARPPMRSIHQYRNGGMSDNSDIDEALMQGPHRSHSPDHSALLNKLSNKRRKSIENKPLQSQQASGFALHRHAPANIDVSNSPFPPSIQTAAAYTSSGNLERDLYREKQAMQLSGGLGGRSGLIEAPTVSNNGGGDQSPDALPTQQPPFLSSLSSASSILTPTSNQIPNRFEAAINRAMERGTSEPMATSQYTSSNNNVPQGYHKPSVQIMSPTPANITHYSPPFSPPANVTSQMMNSGFPYTSHSLAAAPGLPTANNANSGFMSPPAYPSGLGSSSRDRSPQPAGRTRPGRARTHGSGSGSSMPSETVHYEPTRREDEGRRDRSASTVSGLPGAGSSTAFNPSTTIAHSTLSASKRNAHARVPTGDEIPVHSSAAAQRDIESERAKFALKEREKRMKNEQWQQELSAEYAIQHQQHTGTHSPNPNFSVNGMMSPSNQIHLGPGGYHHSPSPGLGTPQQRSARISVSPQPGLSQQQRGQQGSSDGFAYEKNFY